MAQGTVYGVDFGGILDLYPGLGLVEGRTGLVQAIARRLTTPRGSLFYDFEYGYDLRQFLSAPLPRAGVIEQQVAAECLKDERIDDADVSVSIVGDKLTVRVLLIDGDGPFALTCEVSKLTAKFIVENL